MTHPQSQQRKVIEQITLLLAQVDKPDIWSNLKQLIDLFVPFQMAAVFSYHKDYPPVRIFDLTPSSERDRQHFTLLQAAYLVGPYYNRLIAQHAESGFYAFDDIAPDAIKESEYYRVYYSEKNVVDEGMFLVKLEEQRHVGMLLERKEPASPLLNQELDDLGMLAPLISTLIKQHYMQEASTLADSTQRFDEYFSNAFNRFGSQVLTPREKNIAHLILRGHSSKSGAIELNISPNTERVHRRRLYEKLEITSQQELFWIFIESISHYDVGRESDPLETYMNNRRAK